MRLGPPSLAALQFICGNLRARDRDELALTHPGVDPLALADGLHEAWASSGLFGQVAATDEGEPVAVLIVTWATATCAHAALLATERWDEIALAFARHCRRRVFPLVTAEPDRVQARVWAQHASARRFCEFLGMRAEFEVRGWGRDGSVFVEHAWTRAPRVSGVMAGEALACA